MLITHVFGARPQFVKVAMLAKAWRGNGEQFFLHTGQHYSHNLSKVFIQEFEIPTPDVNLAVGSASQTVQTAEMMMGIETVIQNKKPDCIFVYGDTNSTLAGALVASKMRIPLIHIEAGLRSYNRDMPEEENRVVTDHLSNFLFCPTKTAQINLAKEGIMNHVCISGDVMADALERFRMNKDHNSTVFQHYELIAHDYCLLTLHRPSNVDSQEELQKIISALHQIPKKIIFPLHPRTKKMLTTFNLELPEQVKVIPPVGYTDILALETNADCILTDSGGIQKEAYLLGTRCLTLREETEWVETVEVGWNILVGSDPERIIAAYCTFHPSGERPAVFGDFHAAERIVSKTIEWMKEDEFKN